MYFRIAEKSTQLTTGETYLLVRFWLTKTAFDAGDPPYLINDFIMQLRPTTRTIVTDLDGKWQRVDLSWVNIPTEKANIAQQLTDGAITQEEADALDDALYNQNWRLVTITHDVPREIRSNIQVFWSEAVELGLSGDYTSLPGSRGELKRAGETIRQAGPIKQPVQRDDTDPHGVLADPEVIALTDGET